MQTAPNIFGIVQFLGLVRVKISVLKVYHPRVNKMLADIQYTREIQRRILLLPSS